VVFADQLIFDEYTDIYPCQNYS